MLHKSVTESGRRVFGFSGRSRECCLRALNAFAEDQLIAERVVDAKLARAPLLRLDAWVHVTVVLCRQLAMKIVDAGHLDHDVQTGSPVAVMLAQEDDDPVARDAHEQRSIVMKAMLKIDRKAEIADVEFARLRHVKHSQRRDCSFEFRCHVNLRGWSSGI